MAVALETVATWIDRLYRGTPPVAIPRGADSFTRNVVGVGILTFRDSGDRMPNGMRVFVADGPPKEVADA